MARLSKLGLERGETVLDTYWNFTHDVNQDAGGNITQEDMTIGNKTGNWMVFRDDQTTKSVFQITGYVVARTQH